MLGALLAVFPATAVLGLLVLLLALVPAVIGYFLTRTGRADHRRLSLASLVLAPVFLLVAAGVVGANAPAAPVTVSGSPAAVGDTTSLVASPPPTSIAAPAPVIDVPVVDDPAVDTTTTTRAKAVAKAPAAKASSKTSAPTKASAPTKTSAPTKAPAPKKSSSSCDSSTHYVNSSGNCVLRPTDAAHAPGGPSAKCKDGTFSSSQHRSGTCSRHGGVAEWLAGAPSS